jgi:HEPN domain-containing protein/predicted nucleotidyltransferase
MRATKRDEKAQSTAADWIPVIRDRIVVGWQPSRVILFGSHARGDAQWDSDIDLLVVLPHSDDQRRVAGEIRDALADLPVAKDILVTTPEEVERRGRVVGTVLFAALHEGQVIYDMSPTVRMADVRRWLRHAEEDLATAEAILAGASPAPRNAALLAQQGAEKAVKAALILLDIDPPRTHDLNALWDLLPADWGAPPAAFSELKKLGDMAVEARYPGDWAEPSASDAQLAVQRARSILASLRAGFARHGIQSGGNQ